MVSEPEAKAKTAPVSKVIEQMPTAESVQEPAPQSATTQESAEDTSGPTFDQVKTVKHETAFDEWIANGKKIPEGLAFVGGSPWFDEATGNYRSDKEVYELVFGGVTNSSELQGDENVKDEVTFDEWVANGKKIPEGLVFVGGSPWFDEKTGTIRSDMEVYKLIFGCVTKKRELEDEIGVKDETTLDEQVASGNEVLGRARDSSFSDEMKGGEIVESGTVFHKLLEPSKWFCCGA